MNFEASFDGEARMAHLAEAIAFVETFCADHAVDPRDGLRLALLVEELFTNTAVHGHGGGSAAAVRVELRADPDGVTLSYADTAPAFDPLTWLSTGQAMLAAELADRPVGQLGITLVAQMATRLSYERKDGWNCLRLELDRQR